MVASAQARQEEAIQKGPDGASELDDASGSDDSVLFIRRQPRKLAIAKTRHTDIRVAGYKGTVSAKLDSDAEVNLISRAFAKLLNLVPSHDEGCDLRVVGGSPLKTHGVYFVRFEAIDIDGVSRFFEESFLAVDMS